jgi:hypothetical protein
LLNLWNSRSTIYRLYMFHFDYVHSKPGWGPFKSNRCIPSIFSVSLRYSASILTKQINNTSMVELGPAPCMVEHRWGRLKTTTGIRRRGLRSRVRWRVGKRGAESRSGQHPPWLGTSEEDPRRWQACGGVGGLLLGSDAGSLSWRSRARWQSGYIGRRRHRAPSEGMQNQFWCASRSVSVTRFSWMKAMAKLEREPGVHVFSTIFFPDKGTTMR